MATVCPACDAQLNASTQSGAMIFCMGCSTTTEVESRRRKIDRSALVSLGMGLISVACLVAWLSEGDIGSDFIFMFLNLIFGGIAITRGLKALENVNLPQKLRDGRQLAWAGLAMGILTFFAPLVVFSWASTKGKEHVLTKNRVSVHPKGYSERIAKNTVYGKLAAASTGFDESKEVNGYVPLLSDAIQWRVYHPVKSDPKELDPDFHSTFMKTDFDDSEWLEVTDEGDGVGYGDERYGHQLRQPVESEDRLTAYLRTTFETEEQLSSLVMQLRMDDGMFVYVDGERLWKANIPDKGKEAYHTLATRSISNRDEEATIAMETDCDLTPGSHVLAISLHNVKKSSDLGVQRVALHGLPAKAPTPKIDWNVAAPSPLGKLPESSIEFDKSKDANGYQALLPDEISWRVYHPSGTDPADSDSDFHSTFMNADFDDTQWEMLTDTGDGIGYGDDRYGHQLVRPENEANRKTAYFRTTFQTEVPLSRVVIQMRMDDGAFVYVDGKRIWLANLLADSVERYDTLAANSITGDDEEKTIAVEMLHKVPAGTHVLAISLHNVRNSSDLGLQRMMLYGLPSTKPEPAIQWNVAAHETQSGQPENFDKSDAASASEPGESAQ